MVLYINSCVRQSSRTNRIALELLKLISNSDSVTELKLSNENLLPLSEERLSERTRLVSQNDYDNPMFDYAKQFASADTIVISAPYWDFSFPSLLKIYIENIYVTGVVSRFGLNGQPCGMCKAKRLFYVTTAGGKYVPDYSYDYIKALATQHFGIGEVKLIKAEMLDVYGYDAEEIVNKTINALPNII